jgi:hypothetical protein
MTTSGKGAKRTVSATFTLQSTGTAPLAVGNVSMLIKDDLPWKHNTTGCFPDLMTLGGPWGTVAVAAAPVELGQSVKVTFKKSPVAYWDATQRCHRVYLYVDTGCQSASTSPLLRSTARITSFCLKKPGH